MASAADESEHHCIVQPLHGCPHLSSILAIPDSGITADTLKKPCTVCGDTTENWICLHCYQVHCSRYVHGHAELHAIGSEEHPIVGNDHAMALSFSDLSVWCYRCEDYVHHETMANIKKAVHLAKFGN